MKRELNRWSEKLTPEEDRMIWSRVRAALRKGRTGRDRRSSARFLVTSWPGRLALTAALALLAIVIWRVGQRPGSVGEDTTAVVPSPRTATVHVDSAGPFAELVESTREALADSIPALMVADLTEPVSAPVPVGKLPESDTARVPIQPPALTQSGDIVGVVCNTSAKPLFPANILVRGTRWGAMTREDGSFTIKNLPAGRYDLTVQMMGYEDKSAHEIDVKPSETAEVAFELHEEIVATLAQVQVSAAEAAAESKGDRTRTGTAYRVPVHPEMFALQPGVIARGGELQFRGGRAEVLQRWPDGTPMRDPLAGGSVSKKTSPPTSIQGNVSPSTHWGGIRAIHRGSGAAPYPSGTGGTHTVNDALADDMFFRHAGTNPFVDTMEDSLSTFSLDVDTGSYTIARGYIGTGRLPPPEAVRVEEFVNFFRKRYAPPVDGDFRIHIAGMPAPFAHAEIETYRLLRIGIRGRVIDSRNRLPAQVVLVIDTSGSMSRENRLELVKHSLDILLDELRPDDEIGIVQFGSTARVVLPVTPVAEADEIRRAIRSLYPEGSTNAEGGLRLGYEMMRNAARPEWIHHIILCSDGVANVGRTSAERILEEVRNASDRITLTTLGFGMGNYNDILLEQMANAGDGQYAYVDNLGEAARVLKENLTGTLQLIARNAKAQIEFNPQQIARYRLLGYENRDVRDEDFRNNKVDAGEIGAGHEVTILYEVKLRHETPSGRLATVRLRYEKPEGEHFVELEQSVQSSDLSTTVQDAADDLVLDACVAEFAELLRKSYWAKGGSLAAVLDLLHQIPGSPPEEVAEFMDLVERASALEH